MKKKDNIDWGNIGLGAVVREAIYLTFFLLFLYHWN
jgi:hypothetical protein